MITAIEFKNNVWNITDTHTNTTVTADEVIADLEFVRKGYGRGIVHISHGVPMEQVSNMSPARLRTFGVSGTKRLPPPAYGVRRYRLMPGGAIEPFRND